METFTLKTQSGTFRVTRFSDEVVGIEMLGREYPPLPGAHRGIRLAERYPERAPAR